MKSMDLGTYPWISWRFSMVDMHGARRVWTEKVGVELFFAYLEILELSQTGSYSQIQSYLQSQQLLFLSSNFARFIGQILVKVEQKV